MSDLQLPTDIDYIIVGGGLAGLVVANRLSEDPSKKVLVLEAGANRMGDPRVNTPGLTTTMYDDPSYDWMFMTEPQPHANMRRIPCPRGKLLGGTSAINWSVLVYPAKTDFESWADLFKPDGDGDSDSARGWRAAAMAPYFRKFAAYRSAPAELKRRLLMDGWVDESIQGRDGPVPTVFTPLLDGWNEAWMRTFDKLNLLLPGDPVAGEKLGAFQNPLSYHAAEDGGYARAYSASAYYTPEVAQRPNLFVVTEALVEKIVFRPDRWDGNGHVVATGVQFSTTSSTSTSDKLSGASGVPRVQVAHARREVIVCCGAVKSPQLLELSGIGNPDVLGRVGVRPLVDLPGVGENLQDHPIASLSYEMADHLVKDSADSLARDPEAAEKALKQYEESRTGPMSGAPVSFAYLPVVNGEGEMGRGEIRELLDRHTTPTPTPTPARSDKEPPAEIDEPPTPAAVARGTRHQHALLRSHLLSPSPRSSFSTGQLAMFARQLNPTMPPDHKTTTMAEFFTTAAPGSYTSVFAMINHPFSRGHTHIASRDPAAPPRYDPRYLSHPLDLELLARQVQHVNDVVVRTRPFRALLKMPEEGGRTIPSDLGPLSLKNANRKLALDDAKEIVKERLSTAFHPSGTCAMMPRGMGGVVDARLRVYGTANVRVVDASVFPIEPLGNLQSTVYAVAEKGADLIKEDARWRDGRERSVQVPSKL